MKKGLKLPSEILAFKLLKRAQITKEEKLLVLTGMDYGNRATLYDQAKKSLTKFKGDNVSTSNSQPSGASGGAAIKLEPAYLAEHEEALLAAGYVHQRNQYRGGRGGSWRGSSNGRNSDSRVDRSNNWRGGIKYPRAQKPSRAVNPKGPDGEILTCRACGSFRHLMKDCPDSWENMAKANITEGLSSRHRYGEDNIVLFTGARKQEIDQLGVEARNNAVLDSACTNDVCGKSWINGYLDTLDDLDRAKV